MRNIDNAAAGAANGHITALLNTVKDAIGASQRPIFDADYGSPSAHQLDPRNGSLDDDSFTSLQPFGDARVLVVYSFDGNADLSIDGVMLEGKFGDFVDAENFPTFVLGQWLKAIKAEERKAAEISSWGE